MGGVTIRLSGSFAVIHGTDRAGSGVPVTVASRKARRLLARLAAGRRRIVDVEEIVADLWPQRPPLRPADNVATLVSRLRATLAGGGAGRPDGLPAR